MGTLVNPPRCPFDVASQQPSAGCFREVGSWVQDSWPCLLHRLEIRTYRGLLRKLWRRVNAQQTLAELRKALHISDKRHLKELSKIQAEITPQEWPTSPIKGLPPPPAISDDFMHQSDASSLDGWSEIQCSSPESTDRNPLCIPTEFCTGFTCIDDSCFPITTPRWDSPMRTPPLTPHKHFPLSPPSSSDRLPPTRPPCAPLSSCVEPLPDLSLAPPASSDPPPVCENRGQLVCDDTLLSSLCRVGSSAPDGRELQAQRKPDSSKGESRTMDIDKLGTKQDDNHPSHSTPSSVSDEQDLGSVSDTSRTSKEKRKGATGKGRRRCAGARGRVRSRTDSDASHEVGTHQRRGRKRQRPTPISAGGKIGPPSPVSDSEVAARPRGRPRKSKQSEPPTPISTPSPSPPPPQQQHQQQEPPQQQPTIVPRPNAMTSQLVPIEQLVQQPRTPLPPAARENIVEPLAVNLAPTPTQPRTECPYWRVPPRSSSAQACSQRDSTPLSLWVDTQPICTEHRLPQSRCQPLPPAVCQTQCLVAPPSPQIQVPPDTHTNPPSSSPRQPQHHYQPPPSPPSNQQPGQYPPDYPHRVSGMSPRAQDCAVMLQNSRVSQHAQPHRAYSYPPVGDSQKQPLSGGSYSHSCMRPTHTQHYSTPYQLAPPNSIRMYPQPEMRVYPGSYQPCQTHVYTYPGSVGPPRPHSEPQTHSQAPHTHTHAHAHHPSPSPSPLPVVSSRDLMNHAGMSRPPPSHQMFSTAQPYTIMSLGLTQQYAVPHMHGFAASVPVRHTYQPEPRAVYQEVMPTRMVAVVQQKQVSTAFGASGQIHDPSKPRNKNCYMSEDEFISFFRRASNLSEAVKSIINSYPTYKEVSIYARARRMGLKYQEGRLNQQKPEKPEKEKKPPKPLVSVTTSPLTDQARQAEQQATPHAPQHSQQSEPHTIHYHLPPPPSHNVQPLPPSRANTSPSTTSSLPASSRSASFEIAPSYPTGIPMRSVPSSLSPHYATPSQLSYQRFDFAEAASPLHAA